MLRTSPLVRVTPHRPRSAPFLHRGFGLVLLAAALPVSTVAAGGSAGQCQWSTQFAGAGPDSDVSALAVYDDGTGPALFVGGGFTTAGPLVANGIAKWTGHAWSALSGPFGTGVRGFVSALAVYDDGGGPALYVGGSFLTAGNVVVNNVAKWDGGAWSALVGPSGTGLPAGYVRSLAVYDDGGGPALYAGGTFLSAGGSAATHIAKWDGLAWTPMDVGSNLDDGVSALAVYDDGGGPALYVGGQFNFAGGVEVNGIARWDGGEWSALTGPSGTGVTAFGSVQALAVYDDGRGLALYAGGTFFTAGGVPAPHVARWDGAAWSALSGPAGNGTTGGVQALAVYDDGDGPALLAGGYFTGAGGVVVNNVARWDGAAWSALSGPAGSGVSYGVEALTVFDAGGGAALYVGGAFSSAGGRAASYLAKWDGGQWTEPRGPGSQGTSFLVRRLAAYDAGGGSALYAGGGFQAAGGVAVNRIAKWDGAAWSPLSGPAGSGVGGDDIASVGALAVHDDGGGPALYAGGVFLTAGGVTARNVAKWDGGSWSALSGPGGTGTSAQVLALADHDDGGGPALYAGGSFGSAGGVTVNNVARWDGVSWSGLAGPTTTGTNDMVMSLAVYDDGSGPALYAGGTFTSAGGVAVNHVAKWNGTTWTALTGPSGTGTDDSVYTLAVYDDGGGPALYVGGAFISAGGVPASSVARWDGQVWSALSGPSGSGVDGGSAFPSVGALAVYDDGDGPALYVGGNFQRAGGLVANRIARWDGGAWSVLSGPAGTGINGQFKSVLALAVYDEGDGPGLYVGGFFDAAGGLPSRNVAKWDCSPPVFADGFESGDLSAWSGVVP